MELDEVFEGAEVFVLKREKPTGGFGATPLLPPTIEDTYFALNTLSLLKVEPNLENHAKFLLSQDLFKITFEPAFELVELAKMLGILDKLNKDGVKVLLTRCKRKSKSKSLRLSDAFWLYHLAKAFDESKLAQSLFEKTKKLVEAKNRLSMKESYYAYRVLKNELPKRVVESIKETQNPDGGFGFYKGTTSYMENTFYACYILQGFNEVPSRLKELLEFVFNCRNKDGGFGRNPQGISFLPTTYYACWILKHFA